MFLIVQILTITLVALAMAPAIAHALEHPGKMRLGKNAYVAVQSVYYPGFTIVGALSEAGGIIAIVVLLILTPPSTTAFHLTLVALLTLATMQAVYWLLIHPVNRYWLQSGSTNLGNAGARFFAFDPGGRSAGTRDWRKLRERWEYSHIGRAVLSFVSFFSLLLAAVIGR
jgi:hypothetical protein